MLLNNPGGLDGPFIFTSASSTVYAQIHAAGNSSRQKALPAML
jgi:secreted trypsin-like serine protease